MIARSRLTTLIVALLLAASFGSAASQYPAQEAKPFPPRDNFGPPRPVQPAVTALGPSQYKVPPQAIVDLIDAKPTPRMSVSPDNKWILLLEYPPLLPL